MAVVWNAENAAHLLRRATFGARPKDIEKALDKGMGATIAGLFKTPESDTFPTKFNDVYLEKLQAWWLERMLTTKAPLVEKLTLMWHNHFATGYHKVEYSRFMHVQNQVLRKHCLGSFRDLVESVSKSAAMLIWLDGETNVAEDPNENFARELMELFTTGVLDKNGVPNYTEQDVEEGARAFTGWNYTWPKGKFSFEDYNHDYDPKTFKGQTANLSGEDVVQILTAESATARRVAWRLWNSFAYPVTLADPVLDPLETTYLANDTQIRPVVEAMFNMDAFYSSTAKNARVKSPVEWLIGSMRLLNGEFNDKKKWMYYDVAQSVIDLGQSLFDPPSVFGWKEDLAWASSNGLFSRLQYGEEIATSREASYQVFLWQPKKLLPPKSQWPLQTAQSTIDWIVTRLGPLVLQPSTTIALLAYLGTNADGDPETFVLNEDTVDSKVRGLVALLLACPEYQLS